MTGNPGSGEMILYDCVEVPLVDGSYRLTVKTGVTKDDSPSSPDQFAPEPFAQEHFFDVEGPRFTVPQSMIAAVVPPRNGHGSFDSELPHIVLSRRALPWERKIAPDSMMPQPSAPANDLIGPVPWMALLVFEDNEYKMLRNVPLQQMLPADVLQRLGNPANILCDVVEADEDLVQSILPSIEELQLLAHVRQVNVDDRELNTAGGDGFYAVVVANRLPTPNAQCCAVLVSLEGQTDLVQANPPATAPESSNNSNAELISPAAKASVMGPKSNVLAAPAPGMASDPIATPFDASLPPDLDLDVAYTNDYSPLTPLTRPPSHPSYEIGSEALWSSSHPEPKKVRLVALASWQFTCEGHGTFRELMQNLDVGMFGTVKPAGHPPITDTGHLHLTLQDRVGTPEDVWYRSPLTSSELARDPLGPYHCADQARRVAPDTGAEDITYAAAFEVGRLLAVADARFAQSVMRWRRESYKQSMRSSTIQTIANAAQVGLPSDHLHTPMTGIFAAGAAQHVAHSDPRIADAYGLEKIATAPGLQASMLASTWNLSPHDASLMLGADAGTLGTVVTPPQQTLRTTVTMNAVLSDTIGLDRLTAVRQQAIDNISIRLGGE